MADGSRFPRLYECPRDEYYKGEIESVPLSIPRELADAARRFANEQSKSDDRYVDEARALNDFLVVCVEEHMLSIGAWGSDADRAIVDARFQERKKWVEWYRGFKSSK